MSEPARPNSNAPYEERDANTGILFRFGIFLTLLVLVVAAAMYFLLQFLNARSERGQQTRPYYVEMEPLPPFPQLDVHPNLNYHELRKAELRTSTTYGWINQPEGRVRIPIDAAMERVLKKGLPAVKKEESVS